MDDIIINGNDVDEIRKLKKMLAKEFEIKDLGKLRYFLEIIIARSNKGIFLSQKKYVLDLLKEIQMLGCKLSNSPIDPNHNLGATVVSDSMDNGQYQRLVEKLMYLSHTRPNIAFAVGVLSQFMHSPCEVHMEVVLKILRYLKKNTWKGFTFVKESSS